MRPRLAAEDCRHHRAWIAFTPGADIDRVEEVGNVPIERDRIFEIDRMSSIGHDDERGGRNGAFHQQRGLQQGQSSSPVMISVGAVMVFILSTRSNNDGRRACTPRMVRAEPSVECAAS